MSNEIDILKNQFLTPQEFKDLNNPPPIPEDNIDLTCMKCGVKKSVNLRMGYNYFNVWVGIRYICGCGNTVEFKITNNLQIE